jgi:hypothetical protein
MGKLATIATALVLLSSTAYGAEERRSGNFLLPYCKTILYNNRTSFHDVLEGVCMGIVIGVAYRLMPYGENTVYCADIPSIGNSEQLARIVVRFMETHPKELDRHLAYMATGALMLAFPCKKQ